MNPFNKYLGNEDKLQNELVQYIYLKHGIQPIAMNTESNKTPFERFKFKFLGGVAGVPDIFIPKANSKYFGLFLELKAEGVVVFKKDGELRKDKHLAIQDGYHAKLRKNGYFVIFGCGFDHCKKVVDWYLQEN